MDNKFFKNLKKRLQLNEATISTILGGLVVVVIGILIYNYFASVNPVQTNVVQETTPSFELVEENGGMVPDGLPVTHTVAAGENLWKISHSYYQNGFNWVDIAQENKIVNANLIETGQELIIPRKSVKVVVEADAAEAAPKVESDEYLVQKGDSLWKISVTTYNDGYAWKKIWDANKELIANPSVIEPGMLIQLPR